MNSLPFTLPASSSSRPGSHPELDHKSGWLTVIIF
jgi:hypothetical protein